MEVFENNENKDSKAETNEVELENIVTAAEEEERQVQKGNVGTLLFHVLIQLLFHVSLNVCELPLFIPIFDMYFYVFMFSLYTYSRVVFMYMYICSLVKL